MPAAEPKASAQAASWGRVGTSGRPRRPVASRFLQACGIRFPSWVEAAAGKQKPTGDATGVGIHPAG